MGIKNSNLYAEKVYAEHPLGLWAFDEDISYRQLIISYQDFDGAVWYHSDQATEPLATIVTTPTGRKSNTIRMTSGSAVTMSSMQLVGALHWTDFDQSRSTACFSSNVLHSSSQILQYEIGSNINGIETSTFYQASPGWQCLTHTFDIAEDPYYTDLFIRIHSSSGGGVAVFDGASLGQWSEMHMETSNGYEAPMISTPELDSLMSMVVGSTTGYDYIVADAYGIDEANNGYFITPYVSTEPMSIKPAGIPLVYGSNNSVAVREMPNGDPAIAVPGNGFLNESGRYGSYTLEAWVRFNNESLDPVRIIGPLKTTDGIYLEEGFISLYVGPYTKSYFVGKFSRPMLLHMTYSDNRVGLMINGETVISMDIDPETYSFYPKYDGPNLADWIGVYGSQYVDLEIDCLAIFPYLMPPEVAKKHFIYGQAVQEPDFSNDKFVKRTVQFDFPYAEYAYNVIYPDTSPWRSGFSINMDASSSSLKASTYKLPQILLNDPFSDDSWFASNKADNTTLPDLFPYVKINPENNVPHGGAIYFDSLNIINDKIYAAAMTVRLAPTDVGDQVLMSFTNKITGEKIAARIIGTNISYDYFDPQTISTNLYTEPVTLGEYMTVGINIAGLSASFNSVIGNFFSSRDRISVNIGGDIYGTFGGSIYNVHFVNKYFYDKDLAPLFANGIIVQEPGYSTLFNYIGNYSLLPIFKNATMGFDIGAAGYWEDLLPLSMFGKTVTASAGTAYDLDTIQFNIDAPYSSTYGSNFVRIYSYGDMMSFLDLYAHDYDYLASLGFTTYDEIVQYMNDNADELRYATGFGSYVTLQKFDNVGNNLYKDFTNVVVAPQNRVIELTTAANTKFEIHDDCVIIIPDNIDFNEYYLGIHLDVRIRGVYEKNMTIKRLELASFVNNDNSVATKLGTKYSSPIYPFAVAA